MNGIIGTKIGMTSIYGADGRFIACTVVEVSPNVVTQVKTEDTDGYSALQFSCIEAKAKNANKAITGHFNNANTTPKKNSVEFRDCTLNKNLGEVVNLTDVFAEGDTVHARGVSKGKGFQGVVKRHGFSGVQNATHGQHNRQRAPGSIGASSYPSKVVKGLRMAGQTGSENIKIRNLKVAKILPEKNLLLVKGAIPGHKGSIVIIEKN
ncbi:MAG: 50S ribosomal protein L3 [Saprospiraceae bacterium]|nr:50S ribosomal protein L3 [Saprospiraceae bacterium]MBK8449317.1 50S ribosomal protein L3 [Saprospiraceae bacterium]MBK8484613.1 50S ribosomal protein L3 [Saprospiraceae bacterium]MBK9222041.1 50S ribosomal protein L3 [Saprospiraceae bacterium]MBK9721049.1 50S ribosomal protein L3 [Saprospiraceae bacterium]